MNEESVQEFEDWLREEERSENTIDNYKHAIKKYYSLFDEITKKNMIAFKQHMLENYAPKTASVRVIGMNQYCQFLGLEECKVKTIKIHSRTSVENAISFKEYQHLLEGLEADGHEKQYWMVKFLAMTGARVSEFIRFERKHLESGEVTLWTKGKARTILIPQGLIKESREYFSKQPDNKWLFPSRYGQQMTTRGVAQMLVIYGKKYGIRKEVMHPHSFRHLFAIQFMKNNGNLTLLADLMGHSSVNTTAIYSRLSTEEQRKQFNKAMRW